MQSSFEISLPFHNHQKEVTLDDVLHSLKILQSTFDASVAKLAFRVSQERARVTQVQFTNWIGETKITK